MANFIVEEQVLKGVLVYLQGQPFNEVAQLIQAIQQSKPEVIPEKKVEPKKDK